MSARARRDVIMDIIGVDDPNEPPRQPVIALNIVDHSPEENAETNIEFLEKRGFLISS